MRPVSITHGHSWSQLCSHSLRRQRVYLLPLSRCLDLGLGLDNVSVPLLLPLSPLMVDSLRLSPCLLKGTVSSSVIIFMWLGLLRCTCKFYWGCDSFMDKREILSIFWEVRTLKWWVLGCKMVLIEDRQNLMCWIRQN